MRAMIVTAVFVIAGCQTSDSSIHENTTIEVYKYSGARQCMPKSGRSLEQTLSLLNNNKIDVYESSCGYEHRIFPTVCGGGTGSIHIVKIKQKQLSKIKALGFSEITESLNYNKSRCKSR